MLLYLGRPCGRVRGRPGRDVRARRFRRCGGLRGTPGPPASHGQQLVVSVFLRSRGPVVNVPVGPVVVGSVALAPAQVVAAVGLQVAEILPEAVVWDLLEALCTHHNPLVHEAQE